jgi:hypothetical protein
MLLSRMARLNQAPVDDVMKTRSVILVFAILLLTISVGGCATTPLLINEWSNPEYHQPSFNRIMVGGIDGATSIRRNFEDEFVAQLRSAGINALASYRYLQNGEMIDESKLKQAARQLDADAVIVARLVSVAQKTDLGPSIYAAPAFGIFGRNVSATWYGLGLFGGPRVERYEVYTSETTLYDLRKDEVVWTGTLQTTATENTQRAIRNYIETVIKALDHRELLDGRR